MGYWCTVFAYKPQWNSKKTFLILLSKLISCTRIRKCNLTSVWSFICTLDWLIMLTCSPSPLMLAPTHPHTPIAEAGKQTEERTREVKIASASCDMPSDRPTSCCTDTFYSTDDKQCPHSYAHKLLLINDASCLHNWPPKRLPEPNGYSTGPWNPLLPSHWRFIVLAPASAPVSASFFNSDCSLMNFSNEMFTFLQATLRL